MNTNCVHYKVRAEVLCVSFVSKILDKLQEWGVHIKITNAFKYVSGNDWFLGLIERLLSTINNLNM